MAATRSQTHVGSASLDPTYVHDVDIQRFRGRICERTGRAIDPSRPMLTAMRYRRLHVPNALVFLTVVTHRRAPVLVRPEVRDAFRRAFAHVAERHPVHMHAYVVLPDHCHLIWAMPPDDGDFSRRMRLLKHHMSCQPGLPRPLWQKRFWDHIIRDPADLARHMDYVHHNPVKHGWV